MIHPARPARLLYVALARLTDGALLTDWSADGGRDVLGCRPLVQTVCAGLAEQRARVPSHRRTVKVVPGVGTLYTLNGAGELANWVAAAVTTSDLAERRVMACLDGVLDLLPRHYDAPGRQRMLVTPAGAWFALPGLADAVREAEVPDTLETTQTKVDKVKVIMQDNIQQVLTNTRVALDVETRTEDLRNSARLFHRQAHDVRQREFWKRCRTYTALALGIGVILAIVITALVTLSRS